MKKRITLSLFLALVSNISFVNADSSKDIQIIQIHEETFKKQQQCLASAIYFESADKELSQKAVAQTIMNRVLSDNYPHTVCGVVGHKTVNSRTKKPTCQFSYMCENHKRIAYSSQKWENSTTIATETLNDFVEQDREDITKGATHFHDVRVSPAWARSTKFVRTLKSSGLSFYKQKQ